MFPANPSQVTSLPSRNGERMPFGRVFSSGQRALTASEASFRRAVMSVPSGKSMVMVYLFPPFSEVSGSKTWGNASRKSGVMMGSEAMMATPLQPQG